VYGLSFRSARESVWGKKKYVKTNFSLRAIEKQDREKIRRRTRDDENKKER
jgi:hypothetical protein